MNFKFPQFSSIKLDTIVINASSSAIDLLTDMLKWNPFKRPTVAQALRSKYFLNNQKLGPRTSTSSTVRASGRNSFFCYNNLWENNRHRFLTDNNFVIKNENLNSNSKEQSFFTLSNQTSNKNSSNNDPYLNRSRYITEPSTKNSIFRNSGNSFCLN